MSRRCRRPASSTSWASANAAYLRRSTLVICRGSWIISHPQMHVPSKKVIPDSDRLYDLYASAPDPEAMNGPREVLFHALRGAWFTS